MPEGPEVYTVVKKLQGLVNQTLSDIVFVENSYPETQQIYQHIKSYFPVTITAIWCHGKYIFFNLTTKDNITFYLHSHLMMTGRWSWEELPKTKLVFHLHDRKVYFSSKRGLSKFLILTDQSQLQNILSNLGPDILTQPLPFDNWWVVLTKNGRGINRNITSALMDQNIFAGIGNYLKAEILYLSRIHPKHTLAELDLQQIQLLYFNFYDVPRRSAMSGGLTISDYWDPDGNQGVFNKLVYSSAVDPHGYPVLKGKFPDGRSTYYVEQVQY